MCSSMSYRLYQFTEEVFDAYQILNSPEDLSAPSPLLDSILALTAKALLLTENLYTFLRVAKIVETLVKAAQSPFFLLNNDMCEVICYQLFPATNCSNENVRSRASKLVFFLMQVHHYYSF